MTIPVPSKRHSLRAIFFWPLIVAFVSAVGLVAALVGDGPWDLASWVALAIPNLLLAYFLIRAKREAARTGS